MEHQRIGKSGRPVSTDGSPAASSLQRAEQAQNGISRAFWARQVGGDDRRSRKFPNEIGGMWWAASESNREPAD